MPPVRSIITEGDMEDDSEGVDLDGSLASLRVQDLNEMDATAHAANGNRNSNSHRTQPPLYPSSPQRSVQSLAYHNIASSPLRQFRGDSSYAGTSITSRGSVRYNAQNNNSHRYASNSNNNYNEPSLSSIGDDDYEDDDNLEIIKLLRKQVGTLKSQLLAEQQTNQEHKLAVQHMTQDGGGGGGSKPFMGYLPHDSIFSGSSSCFGQDTSDCDSFGEEKESVDNSSSAHRPDEAAASRKKLADAEQAIFASIAALKASVQKQQQQQRVQVAIPTPVEDNDSEHLLIMNELALCELEAHVKVTQRLQAAQSQELKRDNENLKSLTVKQAARIAELERQMKEQK